MTEPITGRGLSVTTEPSPTWADADPLRALQARVDETVAAIDRVQNGGDVCTCHPCLRQMLTGYRSAEAQEEGAKP